MKEKTATDAGGVAVSDSKPSNDNADSTALDTTASASSASPAQQQPAATSVVSLGLSRETIDHLALEMRKALHAVEMGWDTLAKPSDIAKRGETFHVIDGLVIEDYIDRRIGEQVAKCVFVLEFDDGRIETVMQSAARPRLMLCKAVENARLLGASFKAGPYKYVGMAVKGQSQDAVIFERQPGWRQVVR